MPSDGAIVSATTILATIAVVIVVELSSAIRDSNSISVLRAAQELDGLSPFRYGRLPFIHWANTTLLTVVFTFTEVAISDNPTSIITIAVLITLLLLPLLEIDEYDWVLQVSPTRHPLIIPSSLLVQLFYAISVNALTDSFPVLSIFGVVIFPLLLTPLFLFFLTWDLKIVQRKEQAPSMFQ